MACAIISMPLKSVAKVMHPPRPALAVVGRGLARGPFTLAWVHSSQNSIAGTASGPQRSLRHPTSLASEHRERPRPVAPEGPEEVLGPTCLALVAVHAGLPAPLASTSLGPSLSSQAVRPIVLWGL